jgi:hypothetical protein
LKQKNIQPYFFLVVILFFILFIKVPTQLIPVAQGNDSTRMNPYIIPLPELQKPDDINLDDEQIYISEKAYVYIFGLKDFKLKRKFGQDGEGPGEFKAHPIRGISLNMQEEQLLVESVGRMSWFTKKGDFIKQSTIQWHSGAKPLGHKFVAYRIVSENKILYVAVNIYDTPMNKGKEVFRFKYPGQPGKSIDPIMINRVPMIITYKDKIYVDDGLEGHIYVFNSHGKKLETLKPALEKIKVSKKRKEKYILFFKTDYRFKNRYQRDKNRIVFPDYFPGIRAYSIKNDKIYILTYKEKTIGKEILVLDLNGKRIKRVMVPIQDIDALDIYPFAIHKGRIYQLLENLEKESWELHITPIKQLYLVGSLEITP